MADRESVERAFDAAKLAHEVLVAASVAILFFASAPDRLAPYRNAQKELVHLSVADPRSYFRFDFANSGDLIENTRAVMKPVIAAGLPPEVIQTPLYCEFPDARATIKDWSIFANQARQRVESYILGSQSLDLVTRAVRRAKAQDKEEFDAVWILPSSDLDRAEFFIKRSGQKECFPPLSGEQTFALFRSGHIGQINQGTTIPIKVDSRASEGTYFAAWASSLSWPSRKVNDQQLFLATASSLADIYDKTPTQALVIVNDKIDSMKGQVTVLGFSIAADFVLIVGPAAVLALVLYLTVHLVHAGRLQASAEVLRSIPWIGLFPDRLSIFLANISLLLPGAALSVMLFRLWPAASSIVFLEIAAIVSVLGVSLLAARHVRRLRLAAAQPTGAGGPQSQAG